MTKRIGGFRRKTKSKLSKSPRTKGKISLTKYLQEFKLDENVVLKMEPGYQKGSYFPRFHGKSGLIIGKQGYCYKVRIRDGNKIKDLIIHPIHLMRVK